MNSIEGLSLALQLGDKVYVGRNLIGLAKVVATGGQLQRAAGLFALAEAAYSSTRSMNPQERAAYEREVAAVRRQLGEKAFAAAWTQGGMLSAEQALIAQEPAMIPTLVPIGQPPATPSPPYPDSLTPREVEVLRLVAQGLTDAQVAEALVLSRRTVNSYLTTIYSKLGVSSRGDATRYALEQHLL